MEIKALALTDADLERLERDADTWESLTTGDALNLIAAYREAVEAAQSYWEAWQDAALYWKAERDFLRLRVAQLQKLKVEPVFCPDCGAKCWEK